MNRKRDVVAVNLAIVDWLLELIAAHGTSQLRAVSFQLESDAVGIAVATRLVAGPGTGGVGGEQKGYTGEHCNENPSNHARHYMPNLRSRCFCREARRRGNVESANFRSGQVRSEFESPLRHPKPTIRSPPSPPPPHDS